MEKRHISTHSYPWQWKELCGQFHAPAVLTPGKKSRYNQTISPSRFKSLCTQHVCYCVRNQIKASVTHKPNHLLSIRIFYVIMNPRTRPLIYERAEVPTLPLKYVMLINPYVTNVIYIYEAPILDVSRSHTTTQHSR